MWNRLQPKRFPSRSSWEIETTWMTKREIVAKQDLAALEEELLRATTNLEVKIKSMRANVAELRTAVDNSERRLLTAQGDDLKDEVHAALTELGFQVIDSDKERAAEGSRLLEDLEVRDADWVAIAEVRGYSRGAKTSDFQRLARAARGFEQRTSREPDARWYVVNANLSQPPPERRAVLAGAEADVAEFAIDGGCVIDTRDLFRLRESVRLGGVTSEEARVALRTCRGIYEHAV